MVVAFVHRDLVDPGAHRRFEMELVEREIDLGEHLLRDVVAIVGMAENAANHRRHAGMEAPHELLKRTRGPAVATAEMCALARRFGRGGWLGRNRWGERASEPGENR